jgi:hypothetical protein
MFYGVGFRGNEVGYSQGVMGINAANFEPIRKQTYYPYKLLYPGNSSHVRSVVQALMFIERGGT